MKLVQPTKNYLMLSNICQSQKRKTRAFETHVHVIFELTPFDGDAFVPLLVHTAMFDPYILFVNFHVSCLNFHMHFAHIPNLNELKAKFTGNLGVLSPFAGLSRHICESLYIILFLCYTIGLSTYIYIFLSHLMLFLILYHVISLFYYVSPKNCPFITISIYVYIL